MPSQEYKIVFVNGFYQHILAKDLEAAAWTAYDMSRELKLQLKDIIPTHVTKEVLSQQMERNQ